MGGAGFPTGVKLSPKNQNIDYIIINGSECEPYLTSDYRLMVERSKDIIEGISIVLRLLKKPKQLSVLRIINQRRLMLFHSNVTVTTE